MARKKTVELPPDFDGRPVKAMEFEITGGGTHTSDLVISDGDEVEITLRARCVSVKHPFKVGEQIRLHTLNVSPGDAIVSAILQRYIPPEPDPQLPLGDDDDNVTPIK